jgi:hypothetical protein
VGRTGRLHAHRRPRAVRREHGALPLSLCGVERRVRSLELARHAVELGLERRLFRGLLGSRQIELRLRDPVIAAGSAEDRVLPVVEEREQTIVIPLRERVVLVVVALRAGDRGAEPHGTGRVDAIDERLPTRLLDVDAALLVQEGVAVEARRDALFARGVRQHVAGQLLDREPVERHVAVERVDHPVAVLPHRPEAVLLVTVRVGVPGEVEPRPRPPLAVMRRGEQAIDDALVGVRGGVGEEGVALLERRGKADEVERDAAEQRFPRGFGRWRQPLGLEPGEHEAVDGRADPALVADGRRRMAHGPHVRPVLRHVGGRGGGRLAGGVRPRRALVDPPDEERNLPPVQRVLVERHAVLAVEPP